MEAVDELEFLDRIDVIDWDHILDDVPDNLELYDPFPGESQAILEESPATVGADSLMGELEALLMKDDDEEEKVETILKDDTFQLSDLLLDFPLEEGVVRQPSSEPEVANKVSGSVSPSSSNAVGNGSEKGSPNFESNDSEKSSRIFESNGEDEKDKSDDDDDDNDPLSKKRKRQLKNRDAAMRSRERKKIYVKDLEMKSRYLEAECRRLGRLLQCCYAENQMLRYSFHGNSALGAMTNPESAALSLESLLLGSLVWFMVNICLLLQPRLPLLNQDAVALVSVDRKDLESAALRRKGTKISNLWITLSFMRGKGCRASRTRMKSHLGYDVSRC